MSPRVRILCSKVSDGARKLAEALADLKVKRINLVHTKFVPNVQDLCLNWGCVKFPDHWMKHWTDVNGTWLNVPVMVARSTNRLKSLPIMRDAGVPVPEFTTDGVVACKWYTDGHEVVARTKVHSHSGDGIVFVDEKYMQKHKTIPNACLYTKYVPKKDEYRIHVFNGKVVDASQKKRRKGFPDPDYKVRSYLRGWVFCREGIIVPLEVLNAAQKAVHVLGLDFGAVDVGYTVKQNKPTVYEVNTAPGLEGTTVQAYAKAVREYLQGGISSS